LAATRPAPTDFAVDGDLYFKDLVVIRSRLSKDRIGRQTVEAPLTPVLHLSFILSFTGPMLVAGDVRQLGWEQFRTHDARGVQAPVEMHCGDDGFDRIGEQRIFVAPSGKFFPAPQAKAGAQMEAAGRARA